MRGAAVKEGGVSHWYQNNGDRETFEAESPLMLTPQPDGAKNTFLEPVLY